MQGLLRVDFWAGWAGWAGCDSLQTQKMVGVSAISPGCFRRLRGAQGKQTSGILPLVPRSAFCFGLSLHLGNLSCVRGRAAGPQPLDSPRGVPLQLATTSSRAVQVVTRRAVSLQDTG